MRTIVLLLVAALTAGCVGQRGAVAPSPQLAAAEALIDAFYAFDPVRLRAALASAPKSAPEILFYQGWAQGGNYRVVDRRPCKLEKVDEVSCSIQVKDDLAQALRLGFDVTDTFHLTFANGRIVRVETSSDDPPEFKQSLERIGREHPELLDGACKGFFAGGPTPQACVREVVRHFRLFAVEKN